MKGPFRDVTIALEQGDQRCALVLDGVVVAHIVIRPANEHQPQRLGIDPVVECSYHVFARTPAGGTKA